MKSHLLYSSFRILRASEVDHSLRQAPNTKPPGRNPGGFGVGAPHQATFRTDIEKACARLEKQIEKQNEQSPPDELAA